VLLELGADDYMTPFSPRELLARVRAAIRSTRKPIIHDEAEFDGICVDSTTMEVVREGQPIALTAQEFKILKSFLHNEERDVARDELLQEALGYHDYPSLRTVHNHILKLRQKLERDPENPAHFVTTYRAGYRFLPNDHGLPDNATESAGVQTGRLRIQPRLWLLPNLLTRSPLSNRPSLMLALHVCVESIAEGKLSRQSFFIRESHGSEALRNRTQADSFDSNLFLAVDVGGADDQCQSF
jgi:DNA-binding winged helix-turn-helix (wHTH) protein